MPNRVTINWEIVWEEQEIDNFLKDYFLDEEWKIDFNKIIPMPDYIYKWDLWEEEIKKYWKNNWYD